MTAFFPRLAIVLVAIGFFSTEHPIVAQDESDQYVVHGNVGDANNEPVADANIIAIYSDGGAEKTKKTTTNARGEYELSIANHGTLRIVLVAFKPNFGTSIKTVETSEAAWYPKTFLDRQTRLPTESSVEHVLVPEKKVTIGLNDADGNPIEIKSGKLGYLIFDNNSIELPDGTLPIRIENNQATVNGLGLGTSFSLKMDFDQFDEQRTVDFFVQNDEETDQIDIAIPTGGQLSGIVSNMDGKPFGDLSLYAKCEFKTSTDSSDSAITVSMSTKTQTKSDGRFTFSNLPDGPVQLDSNHSRYFLAEVSHPVEIKLGVEATVELVARNVFEVNGRIVDSLGDPLPNMELLMISASKGERFKTDMNGEYSVNIPADTGWININKASIPNGLLPPYSMSTHIKIESNAKTHAVDDIVLERVAPLVGRVLDPEGNPVPNAIVNALWENTDGQTFTAAHDFAFTNEAGEFELRSTTQQLVVELVARNESWASVEATRLAPESERKPVELSIVAEGLVKIDGQVVNSDGKPIHNAEIRLRQALEAPTGNIFGEFPVFEQTICKTDQQGNYKYPVRLARTGKYSVTATAPGYLANSTKMINATESTTSVTVPLLKLAKSNSAHGIVVDSNDQPVSDAEIEFFSPRNLEQQIDGKQVATTMQDGSFVLNNIHPDCHLCFVSKDGFRFRGEAIVFDDPAQANSSFKITLERYEEVTKVDPLKLFSLDEEHRKRLTLGFLNSHMSVPKSEQGSHWRTRYFDFALKVDRDKALEFVKAAPLDAGKALMLFKLQLVDEAMELSNSFTTPSARASAMAYGAKEITDLDARRQVLREAALHNSAILELGNRVESLAGIIESLYDCGDIETAKALAESGMPMARSLGQDGRAAFGTGWMAKATVEMFPEESVEMISSIESENSFDRNHGNLAHEIAAIDPELAETLLGKIEKNGFYIARVVYRMAAVDPERALKIANNTSEQSSSQDYKTNALACLAYGLKDSNPELAKDVLGKAFDDFHNERDHRYTIGVAINLLRVACEVAPENSDYYFWRTLNIYADPNSNSWGVDEAKSEHQLHLAKQCLLLVLFDKLPEVRQQILLPILEDYSNFDDKDEKWFGDGHERARVIAVLALGLPDETLKWQNEYYSVVPDGADRYLPQSWTVIGNCWTKTDQELIDFIAGELENTWVIDKENF